MLPEQRGGAGLSVTETGKINKEGFAVRIISSLLLAALLLCPTASASAFSEGGGEQVIDCPEQGFSVSCSEDAAWEFSRNDGVMIYTEYEGSIPYVLVYRGENEIADAAEFIQQCFTPYMENKYGDDLILIKEYKSLRIGGRDMPAGLYSYLLQGYRIDMLRAYEIRDGETVAYTAKFIHGQGDATLEALHRAVSSYRTNPETMEDITDSRG